MDFNKSFAEGTVHNLPALPDSVIEQIRQVAEKEKNVRGLWTKVAHLKTQLGLHVQPLQLSWEMERREQEQPPTSSEYCECVGSDKLVSEYSKWKKYQTITAHQEIPSDLRRWMLQLEKSEFELNDQHIELVPILEHVQGLNIETQSQNTMLKTLKVRENKLLEKFDKLQNLSASIEARNAAIHNLLTATTISDLVSYLEDTQGSEQLEETRHTTQTKQSRRGSELLQSCLAHPRQTRNCASWTALQPLGVRNTSVQDVPVSVTPLHCDKPPVETPGLTVEEMKDLIEKRTQQNHTRGILLEELEMELEEKAAMLERAAKELEMLQDKLVEREIMTMEKLNKT